MEVSINSELVLKLNVGDKVEVKDLENDLMTYHGRILRINEKVDLSSQTVNVFIELSGHGLKEGMYLRAYLQSKVLNDIMEIPRNLLIDQHKLYLIQDSLLVLSTIQVIHQNEQSIVVRGLKDKDQLLIKPVPKAFEGMKVAPIASNKALTKVQ